MIVGAKRRQRSGVVDWIKPDDEQRSTGLEHGAGWEIEINAVPNVPDVRRISWIEERNWHRGDIPQLDEFISSIVTRGKVRRMVHDFGDDNRTHAGIGIGEARAPFEFSSIGRIVDAEGTCFHGSELLLARTVKIPAERDPVISRAEFDTGPIPGKCVVARGREDRFLPMRTQGKRNRCDVAVGELALVEHRKTKRWNHPTSRNLVFLQGSFVVTQPPPADVDRLSGEIL